MRMNRARAIFRHLEIEYEAVVGCGLFEFIAPFYKRHAIAFGNAVIVDIFELFRLFQTIQIKVIQRQAAIVVFAHQIERGACGNFGNAESRSEALREVGFARAQISHEQNHIAWLHTLRNRASKLLGFFNAMAYVRHASPFPNAIPNVEIEASGNKKKAPLPGPSEQALRLYANSTYSAKSFSPLKTARASATL